MTSSNLFEVNKNILPAVCQKYDRTITSLNQDVHTLKNWMKSQPHFPEILDDKILQNFLIFSKCSVEKAKSRIDMYYTLRGKIPEIFDNINPEKKLHLMDAVCFLPLPKLTNEMYRVFVSKVKNPILYNEISKPDEFGILLFNMEEIRLKEDVMFGDIFIIDFQHMVLSVIKRITPTMMMKIVQCYAKIFSMPIKAIYIVNSASYVHVFLTILKAVLKPKIFERIFVSKDTKILLEKFPKEILPTDYGGEEKSLDELNEMLKSKLKEHKTRFDDLDKLRVNESLRPEPLKDDEVLGFYGNFKKLEFD